MIYLLFYQIGFILAYYLCKQLRDMDDQNDWSDIKISVMISFLSWLAVILIIVGIALESKDRKPPKGL